MKKTIEEMDLEFLEKCFSNTKEGKDINIIIDKIDDFSVLENDNSLKLFGWTETVNDFNEIFENKFFEINDENLYVGYQILFNDLNEIIGFKALTLSELEEIIEKQ